jgi:competence protein ComGC
MTGQQVSDKKGKSLGENMFILGIIAILMASFLHYFFKQEDQFTQTGFSAVANVFSSRVIGIHGQWFMDKQPNVVVIKSKNIIPNQKSEDKKIPVNTSGWVDVNTNAHDCEKIWQHVLEMPMQFMKQPVVGVIKMVNNPKSNGGKRFCQYRIPSGEYFEYQPHNGKVSSVKIVNN